MTNNTSLQTSSGQTTPHAAEPIALIPNRNGELIVPRQRPPENSEPYIGGTDGGSSGASAFLSPAGEWHVQTVFAAAEKGHRLLSVDENEAYLDAMAARAGGFDRLVIAYELSRKNKMFGYVNNFTNGRNEEFWRVLLRMKRIRCIAVDPKTWQCKTSKGIRGPGPKDRAREYIRQRCPGTDWLDSYNKAPREAIVDAMCIALWCKDYWLVKGPAGFASARATGI